ncbi:iron-containing alcohol dehydrogenase [Micrococcus sp. ACRRV]|uniref:iron-containing alcohol dehydrogenase n=1 Tax=Micrococcus sp. ACRRV TaxID=2918203 RepID=UPI00351D00FC
MSWRRDLTTFSDGKTIVVVDEGILNTHRQLLGRLRAQDPLLIPVTRRTDPLRVWSSLRENDQDWNSISAIGGGSAMDVAKILKLLSDRILTPQVLESRTRQPLIVIPTGAEVGRTPLDVIPTNFGTGSHASDVAIYHKIDQQMRVLIVGAALRPRSSTSLSEFALSMTHRQIDEGLREMLYRFAGPLLMDCPTLPTEVEEQSISILRKRLAGTLDLRREWSTILSVSGSLHRLDLRSTRKSFSHRLWYLANELSTLARVSKMTATDYLARNLWRREIVAGSMGKDVFGNVASLDALGRRLTESSNGLQGVLKSLDANSDWQPPADVARRAIRQCRERWATLVAPGEEWCTEELHLALKGDLSMP